MPGSTFISKREMNNDCRLVAIASLVDDSVSIDMVLEERIRVKSVDLLLNNHYLTVFYNQK